MKSNEEFNDLVLSCWESAIPSTNGWSRANCPVCIYAGQFSRDRRMSLGIHESGFWKCFRCEERGFLKEIGGDDIPDAVPESISASYKVIREVKVNDSIPLPDEFIPLWKEPGLTAVVAEPARRYLEGRNFYRDHWEKANIGFCARGYYSGRVIVPVYNVHKTHTVGFCARLCRQHNEGERKTVFPKGMKKGDILYEQQLIYQETAEPLLVFEGVFDVLPYFGQACCTFGKPGAKQYSIFKEARRPMVMVYDADTDNLSWSLANKLRLDGKRAGYVRLPNGKDADEVDPEWLLEKARTSIREGV